MGIRDRGRRAAALAVALAVGASSATVGASVGGVAQPGAESPSIGGAGAVFNVGAASRSVLPTVDGARDFLADLPLPTDAYSPGVFVPEWDQGQVAIGNGFNESHWVRDDLRASAMALEGDPNGPIAVLVSADVYMLIEPDLDVIRDKVAEALDPALSERVDVLVGATHTHHGPDTIELEPGRQVNFEWMDLMTDEVAAAVVEAVESREPATLQTGSGQHWYGAANYRDPRVIDASMNVMQAVGLDGDVIATAVQWTSHPEMTLNWKPEIDGGLDISAECAAAVPPLTTCTAEGRYHTADYPGHLRRVVQHEVGGEVLYFVGALGSMVSPWRTIWEIDELVGLGDHYTPPADAEFPGTGAVNARDFRRAAIVGEQAGLAALEILAEVGRVVVDDTIEVRHQQFFTRLSNIGFRYLLRLDGDGHPYIGGAPTPVFSCPDAPADYGTCVDDGGSSALDGLLGDVVRTGDHIRPSVSHLRVGPVGMLFTPGEVQSHLVRGFPVDFGPSYYDDPTYEFHAGPDDLSIPGALFDLLDAPEPWFIGLGQGAIGYVIPIDDWRVYCVADALAGPGTCAGLHVAGLIAHPDSLSGAQCKLITEDPAAALGGLPGGAAMALAGSCQYGQAFGEAREHYEETNAVGWDVAADMHAAVEEMMGTTSDTQVDPDFVGYWQSKLGTPPPPPDDVDVRAGNKWVEATWTTVPEAVSYRVRLLPDGPTRYVDGSVSRVRFRSLTNDEPVRVAVSARGSDWLRSASAVSDEIAPTHPGRGRGPGGVPPGPPDHIPPGRGGR